MLHFHPKDNLLDNITFENLIIAVECNESVINEEIVRRVYKELLKVRMDEALYELNIHMPEILKELKRGLT